MGCRGEKDVREEGRREVTGRERDVRGGAQGREVRWRGGKDARGGGAHMGKLGRPV